MKKLLLCFVLSLFSVDAIRSQCVQLPCSTYVATAINFTTFPSSGTPLSLSDDAMSGPIPLGFSFQFYCNNYTDVDVSSNGFLTFILNTGNSACCSGVSIPTAASPNNYIALFWNDLYPPGAGFMTYTTVGTAPNRQFILTYSMVPHCCTAGPPDNSGQIVLYETTNVIELYTGNVTNDGSLCTQGIEDATGSPNSLPTPGRNATTWSTTNSAYRFSNVGLTNSLTPIVGNTTSCLGDQQVFSVLPAPGAVSYNWTLPGGWTGTSTNSAITATVAGSGTISVSASYTCGNTTPVVLSFSTIMPPVVAIAPVSPNLICSGNTVAINTSGAVFYTLEPGTITNGPPFIVNPNVTTTYTLYGVDATNCTSINGPVVTVFVNETPSVTVNSGEICIGQSFTINPSGANSYIISGGFAIVSPISAGVSSYTVVGTGTNGCVSSPAISNVTVNPLPNVQASSSRTVICKNETTTITANGANTYSWSNGASGSPIVVSPTLTTLYTVTGVGTGGCTKTAQINIKVDQCIGLNENSSAKSFVAVYPNPSSGEFTLKTKEVTTVMIYDMQGKLIYNQKVNEGNQVINLSQYASGEYLLKAYQGDNEQRITLIKQ